ncbi:DNA adenine methylase [Capnocytophaga catalasegens]|uniref:site-specific DNA-methyltransferase (adenine-specific) n=1 Tax=Capnocytophaga catalasegens TaxID=1004260 RepID=A0AAV5ARW9_9FLAO|nr:DNA adenine methylase [Capnocytophaga catalasegens]GIZ15094.1 restriction endonuclease subunit M [Capnocytophaga catalasegens]GJM50021.1 restriction endonuclease subunit M [Capnocytophaga catalasegens]GJM53892.1 restriction endonuclease subunit M [Capnocytophaga catalasegens]
MNYIGSKYKLSEFIKQGVHSVVGQDLSNKVFCDLFAGTGIVGRSFKKEVKQVISNDIEYYSFVLNKNYIGNYEPMDFSTYIDILNALQGEKGFIFEQYSEGGKAQRQYFKQENGKKIDAIRKKIEQWHKKSDISDNLYYFLLASLLESADKVANTASVYGAFLKHIKKSAQKDIFIEPAYFTESKHTHLVFNKNANDLIQTIQGDILYLDPPYNAREYGANYHLLNTIAMYDSFEPKGKTGLRNYQKSMYCKKNQVIDTFDKLIKQANFQYIFLSYNNEGLMTASEIQTIMRKYGSYDLVSTNYQRFKADKEENRNHKAEKTTEFLHILQKN